MDLKSDEVFSEDCNVKMVEKCQGFAFIFYRSSSYCFQALEYAKVDLIVNWLRSDVLYS
jgi:hypothetical protein